MESSTYFPQLMGTEEETRVPIVNYQNGRIYYVKDIEIGDQRMLNAFMNRYCPPIAYTNPPGHDYFRHNGSRTYDDERGLELATAEITDPEQLPIYINANALLMERALGDFVIAKSRSQRHRLTAVFQRRVIDKVGNSWGCHDNLSINEGFPYSPLVRDPNQPVSRIWQGFLYSRNFITGSLFVGNDGNYFSQKLSQPHKFIDYGFINSLMRTNCAHGQRAEIRCNDVNLMDWSTISRIGGAALLLAATQTTDLVRSLKKTGLGNYQWPRVDDWNDLPLNKDLEIVMNDHLARHIEMQRQAFTTILDGFMSSSGEPIPSVYRCIGTSILQFCDDMEKVALGKADINLLADRADWAAKLYTIRKDIRKSSKKRFLGDNRSKAYDLMYDQIKITADPNGSLSIVKGYGYTIADHYSKLANRQELIEVATTEPPSEGRAKLRVDTARRHNGKVSKCDWHYLTVIDGNNKQKIIQLDEQLAS